MDADADNNSTDHGDDDNDDSGNNDDGDARITSSECCRSFFLAIMTEVVGRGCCPDVQCWFYECCWSEWRDSEEWG